MTTAAPARPKRILALSGGGVRGIIEVAFLEHIERAYQQHYGPQTRLCDVFDLMGGTSTGALIATALALGHPLDQVRDFYLRRARTFFDKRKWWAFGRAPVFDSAGLEQEIRADVGDITLGSDRFQTAIAIVAKRIDTGAPWVMSNLPEAPHFQDAPDGSYIGNRHYTLAKLLRASTAAPTLFQQQTLQIADDIRGVFVDGGLSPYNDPSLALLQLARMRAYGLNWATGPDRLYVLSLGSGRYRQRISAPLAARMGPLRTALMSLQGLMIDAEHHSLTMMEWLGTSRRPSWINADVGTLAQDTLAPDPLFSYLRLDVPLEPATLAEAGISLPQRTVRRFQRMDDPEIIAPLYDLAQTYIDKTLSIQDILTCDPGLQP